MANLAPRPKTRAGGRTKNAERRRDAQRRKSVQRWSLVSLVATVLTVIVFLSTRPEPPGKPATSALTGGDFHSLVVDPENPNRIFAGGHTAVSVSTDRGRTWREVGSLKDADAMGWAFSGGKIFVGGHPGISISDDGGKTFKRHNQGLPATDIHSLGAGVGVIYAGSPQAGFIASTDGGMKWEVRSEQAGRSFMGHIVVDPRDIRHIFAPDMAGGVAESADGGRSWRDLGGVQGAIWVSLDPKEPQHLIASGGGRAAESVDAGHTWRRLDLPGSTTIVEFSTKDSQTLYAGSHDGERASVEVSRDGGKTWQEA